METKQVKVIDYYELDRLVNEYLNIDWQAEKFRWDRGEKCYSFIHLNECHNDAYYSEFVYDKFNDDKQTDFQPKEVAEWESKARQAVQEVRNLGELPKSLCWDWLCSEDILGLMCKDGILEEGEYMVHVSW